MRFNFPRKWHVCTPLGITLFATLFSGMLKAFEIRDARAIELRAKYVKHF